MTRRRSTGPDRATTETLIARAGGRCEICDRPLTVFDDWSRHHRLPRRMGGTRVVWINDVSNLLFVCGTGVTGCHGRIESNRAIAYDMGWLLRAGEHPAEVPCHITTLGAVYLTSDGTYDQGNP